MASDDTPSRMGACAECGYRPWPSELDDAGGACPECGWHPDDEGGE